MPSSALKKKHPYATFYTAHLIHLYRDLSPKRYRLTPVFSFFFFNDTATTEIYTLSLHDALPICQRAHEGLLGRLRGQSRPGKRLVCCGKAPRPSPPSDKNYHMYS